MTNYIERPYCRHRIYQLMKKHNCRSVAELYQLNGKHLFLFGKYKKQCKKMLIRHWNRHPDDSMFRTEQGKKLATVIRNYVSCYMSIKKT